MFAQRYILEKETREMSKKEQMIIEVARLYKGITVAQFERLFSGMTANEIEGWLHQAKKLAMMRGLNLW
jgi:hypothetical protein